MKFDLTITLNVLLKRVIKNRFVILLINFEICKIDNKCEKNKEIIKKIVKKVKISYFIVKRDKRENFNNAINRKLFRFKILIFLMLKLM